MFWNGDAVPNGYLTIAEIKDQLKAGTAGREKFAEEVRLWIAAAPPREQFEAEVAEAAEEARKGNIDAEQYKKIATRAHRGSLEAFAREQLAIETIASALSSGALPAFIRDPETKELGRILPADWHLMHLKHLTIIRGWLSVNPHEPYARFCGSWVLVSETEAERFLALFGERPTEAPKRGRPTEHDWDGAAKHLAEQYPPGSHLPKIQTRVTEQAEEWFEKNDAGKKAPNRKDIRLKLVSPLYKGRRLGGK